MVAQTMMLYSVKAWRAFMPSRLIRDKHESGPTESLDQRSTLTSPAQCSHGKPQNMHRRHFNAAALIGCSTLLSAPLARAQAAYPNKPIKFFVPYVAGGQPDTVARVVAPRLGERLGQPVVVDNRPGAAGSAAFNALQQFRPADGHAFMVTDGSILSVSPLINAAANYRLDKDYVPVSLIGRSTLFLLTHPKTGIKTLQELVSAVRQKPGEYTYASAGIGSVHHLTMESFNAALNLNMRHVPYRGTGQSTPALVAGQVDFSIAALPSVAGFVQSGHLRL
ncbi:MAG: tripartite tricarboxylate transporter receptor family protein, partial [Rhodoferax sp.]|nr:tripartite tricarboxylate transporter receptor family protein [Rhodoferax sp.]